MAQFEEVPVRPHLAERLRQASPVVANVKRLAAAMTGEWFAVRCVFHTIHDGQSLFEERITLWHASDVDAAIVLAEEEAGQYAAMVGEVRYLGLAQAYHLAEQPEHGAEIFSLIRGSDLAPEQYLDTFFDTGRERQRHTGSSENEHPTDEGRA